jgi:hypothetical protein
MRCEEGEQHEHSDAAPIEKNLPRVAFQNTEDERVRENNRTHARKFRRAPTVEALSGEGCGNSFINARDTSPRGDPPEGGRTDDPERSARDEAAWKTGVANRV